MINWFLSYSDAEQIGILAIATTVVVGVPAAVFAILTFHRQGRTNNLAEKSERRATEIHYVSWAAAWTEPGVFSVQNAGLHMAKGAVLSLFIDDTAATYALGDVDAAATVDVAVPRAKRLWDEGEATIARLHAERAAEVRAETENERRRQEEQERKFGAILPNMDQFARVDKSVMRQMSAQNDYMNRLHKVKYYVVWSTPEGASRNTEIVSRGTEPLGPIGG